MTRVPHRVGSVLFAMAFGALAACAALSAAAEPPKKVADGPFVSAAVPALSSLPLKSLPIAKAVTGPEKVSADREKPAWMNPAPGWATAPRLPDPLAATGVSSRTRTPAPGTTVDGATNTCGCTPPDTVGAAGPNHYVQMVNATTVTVYDKTGTLVSGPTAFNSLWPSGNCAASTAGDPVVLWDPLASRFLMAQFSTGNGICVAVSKTSDPTGAFWLYEFSTPSLPDYFKIGIWPTAYFVGANETNYSALALDRTSMLSGAAATSIRFTLTNPQNFLMPANVVGPTAPPGGSPGILYTFLDNSFHGIAADRLDIYHFTPNFTTPASSTFTLAQSVLVSSFTYTVCGFFTLSCAPQPGTTRKVDVVSEWPMWQLQYRNMGAGGEHLVGNFTVDAGSGRAGIRWFELTKSGGTYTLAQEGTFAPAGTAFRFMGSIAIDKAGGIALAYTTSDATSPFPSLRYTTRLASDPSGTMQAEATLFAGGGSQTSSGSRWGDYSALTVDPTDDCTFWYTNEYYSTTSASSWKTRIGKFVMPECLAAPVHLLKISAE